VKLILACTIAVAVAALFVSGCAEEVVEEEFDDAALLAVDQYVEEMTEAVLDVKPDLQGWIREPYQEDLPLRYDEERIEWLGEHRDRLTELDSRYREGDFPADEEITAWQVVVVRGDKEWLLKGNEVLEALNRLDQLTGEVSGAIEIIEVTGGELDMDQSEEIIELIDKIEPVVEQIRGVFFR